MKYERWKTVPGYSHYQVSNLGRVRSTMRMTPMRAAPNPHGYLSVVLVRPRQTWSVHTLVLLAFRGEAPLLHEAAHLNGRRGDNRLSNLIWATKKQNQRHRIKHGTRLYGSKLKHAKLTEEQVRYIRKAYFELGVSQMSLAREFKMTSGAISMVCAKRTWKHV